MGADVRGRRGRTGGGMPGLEDLPRLHERERVVEAARAELGTAIAEIVKKHELTLGETLRVVSSAMGGEVQLVARTLIRYERHGSGDKAGGLE